jgi:hypothetical protein
MTARAFSYVGLLALALTGCMVGEHLVGSRGDYRLYRETRVAKSELERIAAAHRYLESYPNGRYHAEVRPWVERTDVAYVRSAWNRPGALRDYLALMPKAPRSEQVRNRLTELEIQKSYTKRDADRERARLSRVARELGDATRTRQEFVQRFVELTSKLSGVRSFGLPVSALEPGFAREFQGKPGVPGCTPERCGKSFEHAYSVPGASRFIARTARIELALHLVEGRVSRGELGGDELFSRVGEAVDRQAVEAASLSGRVEAIARSVQVVENALEAGLPAAECAREAVAPAVLVRDCRGVRVEMRVGVEPPFRDAIEVKRSQLPPMP